jgi:ribosomal protein L40E
LPKTVRKKDQKSYEHIEKIVIWKKVAVLVYCTKCGAGNEENATVCINCNAVLGIPSPEEKLEVSPICRKHEECRRWGGALIGVLIGIIMLLIGFSLLVRQLYGFSLPWLELIMIFFGVYLVTRALKMNRNR